jgi:hypothetical protein
MAMAGKRGIVSMLLLLGAVSFEFLPAAEPRNLPLQPAAQESVEKAGDVGTLAITESGFLRKNKVTEIRYRKSDFSIVSVSVNGEAVPSSRFGEYRDVLLKALEYPRIRDFQARIEAIEKGLKSLGPVDPGKRGQLDRLLADLEEFIARASPSNRAILDPLVKSLSSTAFQKLVRELLVEKKLLSPGEGVRLMMRSSQCEVNGRELPPDVAAEILSLWAKYSGEPISDGEKVTFIFDPERSVGFQPEEEGQEAMTDILSKHR